MSLRAPPFAGRRRRAPPFFAFASFVPEARKLGLVFGFAENSTRIRVVLALASLVLWLSLVLDRLRGRTRRRLAPRFSMNTT